MHTLAETLGNETTQQASWGKSSEPENRAYVKTQPHQGTRERVCLCLEISAHTNKMEPLFPPGTDANCASQAGFIGWPCCQQRPNTQRSLCLDNGLLKDTQSDNQVLKGICFKKEGAKFSSLLSSVVLKFFPSLEEISLSGNSRSKKKCLLGVLPYPSNSKQESEPCRAQLLPCLLMTGGIFEG